MKGDGLIPRRWQRLRPRVHAGTMRLSAFEVRHAVSAPRFGLQASLLFVFLLLLASPFLFTLLKCRFRFLCHSVSHFNVPYRRLHPDAGRLRSVLIAKVFASTHKVFAAAIIIVKVIFFGAEAHGSGGTLAYGAPRSVLSLRGAL